MKHLPLIGLTLLASFVGIVPAQAVEGDLGELAGMMVRPVDIDRLASVLAEQGLAPAQAMENSREYLVGSFRCVVAELIALSVKEGSDRQQVVEQLRKELQSKDWPDDESPLLSLKQLNRAGARSLSCLTEIGQVTGVTMTSLGIARELERSAKQQDGDQ